MSLIMLVISCKLLNLSVLCILVCDETIAATPLTEMF